MEEERKIQITDLPVDTLRLISLFVSVNNLTSTCRDLFFGFKPQLYWRLNRTHSLKYYEDEEFRALVHSRIENISSQLSLWVKKRIKPTLLSASLPLPAYEPLPLPAYEPLPLPAYEPAGNQLLPILVAPLNPLNHI